MGCNGSKGMVAEKRKKFDDNKPLIDADLEPMTLD